MSLRPARGGAGVVEAHVTVPDAESAERIARETAGRIDEYDFAWTDSMNAMFV